METTLTEMYINAIAWVEGVHFTAQDGSSYVVRSDCSDHSFRRFGLNVKHKHTAKAHISLRSLYFRHSFRWCVLFLIRGSPSLKMDDVCPLYRIKISAVVFLIIDFKGPPLKPIRKRNLLQTLVSDWLISEDGRQSIFMTHRGRGEVDDMFLELQVCVQ